MQEYVLGFVFDLQKKYVALIRKDRPDYQAGFLNGVGGKIESNENPLTAIIRETLEETGVLFSASDFHQIDIVQGESFKIYCYKAFTDISILHQMKCDESESIEIHMISNLYKEKTYIGVMNLIEKSIN